MPAVDIADETYIARLAAVLAPAVAGALTGSMEIWLEPVGEGTVLHWFLRADPPASRPPRRAGRDRERRVRTWKSHAFALKDRLEGAERVT